MTFDEAKAKFSALAVCPACHTAGQRIPYFVTRGRDCGRMQWDCASCGHPAYSETAEPLS